jgi:ABC-type transporter Mla subunit MlaD
MGEIDIGLVAREYWHIGIVAITLFVLALDFLWRFLFRSIGLSRELSKAIAALQAISDREGELIELDEVANNAMASPALTHLWGEYVKTLHPQRQDDGTGQSQIVRWRSTALAETFFSEQVVVDGRLKTEFFKHLPGVLTGLGIIGTFAGLIKGLVNFKVNVDPTSAQEQLQALVNSVGHAFYVSATAIGLAMIFTWIEKSVVTARYHQVEQLRELIDSLFRGGAGEEYLERLVTASETSATQAAQIKDSLVADLKEILSSLTAQQIQAQAQHSGQLSADVSKSIADTLTGPMDAITKAVQNVSSNQGEAVNKMLTDVLATFGSQMKEMFGGQMSGMTDLMLKASEAMQATAMQFGQLAANMDAAGTNTVDAMGEKLAKALDNMDARQAAMNAQMGAFVEQIRSLVSQSQNETNDKLREALTAMGGQVAGVVEELRKQAEESAESQGARSRRFEESTGQAIGSLSGQVESLLSQSMETNKSLQASVASLSTATDKAITGLNSGAETLYVAASDFAKAGQGVSDTMKASTAATEAIRGASTQLTMATENAKGVFVDYAKTRDTFATMIAELKSTFEAAKRDASMTSELIRQIESATKQLATAQKQSEDYLKGVSEVLVKAHDSFRENVERTLGEGNRKFQGELTTAVGHLSSAIKNLGDVVDDIPPRR